MEQELKGIVKALNKVEEKLHDTGDTDSEYLDEAFRHVVDCKVLISRELTRLDREKRMDKLAERLASPL